MKARLSFVLVAAVSVFGFRPVHCQEADLADLIPEGKRLFAVGKLADALRVYEAAYKRKKIPTVALNIGLLNLEMRRFEQAKFWCGLSMKGEVPSVLRSQAEQCQSEARAALASRTVRPKAIVSAAPQSGSDPPPVAAPSAMLQPLAAPGGGKPSQPVPGAENPPAPMTAPATPPEPVRTALPPPDAVPAESAQRKKTEAMPAPTFASTNQLQTARRGEYTPLYKRWWFWTLIGAGAAGTAAGITAGVLIRRSAPAPSGDPLAEVPLVNRRIVEF